jgi:hypothetical protein
MDQYRSFQIGKETPVGKFVVMLALGLATASVANADIGKRDFGNARGINTQAIHAASSSTSGSGTSTAAVSAPEIDPAGIMSGMTLLLGGLAVLRGRRKS